MKFETGLSLVDYSVIVENIVDGYFDFDGIYQPHIGQMNAMRIFYNNCVKESVFDEKYPHTISDIMDMQEIVNDTDFIEAFNTAIQLGAMKFDFANAFDTALSIVDMKKSSVGHVVEIVKKALIDLASELNRVMTPENMESLKMIANAIGGGESLDDVFDEAFVQNRINKTAT